jgi:hypothetical protein
LNDLSPEYEVRDLNNRYRYLDLAYMPGGVKGCIEIHDYSIMPGMWMRADLKICV